MHSLAQPRFDGQAFICKKVYEGTPVLRVYRESDGDWQMLCAGEEHESADQCLLAHPEHLLELDPTIGELADLPFGYVASRDAVGAPWVRSVDVE